MRRQVSKGRCSLPYAVTRLFESAALGVADTRCANAGNRQHSPNEHLRLDHLFQGVRTTAQLLRDLG